MESLTGDRVKLLRLLLWAALRARVAGCSVHVYRDFEGLNASEFIPVGKQRQEWLRVTPAGSIEEGGTGRVIGSTKDILTQH